MSTTTIPTHSVGTPVRPTRRVVAAMAAALALAVASTVALTVDDPSSSTPTAGKKFGVIEGA